MTAETRWLTLTEASKWSGVPRETLRKWIYREDNPLPSVIDTDRKGRSVRRVSSDDLDNYKRPQMGGKR